MDIIISNSRYELSEEITLQFEKVKLHFELFLKLFQTVSQPLADAGQVHAEKYVQEGVQKPRCYSAINSMTFRRMPHIISLCEYTVLPR